MVQLAKFEGYHDNFHVSKDDLARELESNPRSFHVRVALDNTKVVGFLVYYFLPFTYDMKPWLHIKELYVVSEYRKTGVGAALMYVAQDEALNYGCSQLTWQVLASNSAAQQFYQSLGAKQQDQWQLYHLTL